VVESELSEVAEEVVDSEELLLLVVESLEETDVNDSVEDGLNEFPHINYHCQFNFLALKMLKLTLLLHCWCW
jgi:hypothetical protein